MAEETVHRPSGESKPGEVTREKEEHRSGEVRREEVREERRGGRSRRVRRVEVVQEGPKGRDAELTIVDLGKKSRKSVRDLRRGKGRLMDDIEDTIEELRDGGAIPEGAHPVVILVERRLTEQGGMFPFLLPPGIPGLLSMSMRREDDEDDEDDDDDDDD